MRNTAKPRFTRKHYEAIAEALAAVKPADWAESYHAKQLEAWEDTVRQLVGMFKADNPAFKPGVFYKAAGCSYLAER